MNDRISIICVAFNSQDHIADAIGSAVRSAEEGGLGAQVIVVDNASTDGTIAAVRTRLPQARLVENEVNVGFASASNQGMELADGTFWLIINPDAQIEGTAVAQLVKFMATTPRAGAVAPSIESGLGNAESGGMQPGLRSAIGHFLLVNRLLKGDRGGAWRGFQLHSRSWLGPRRVDWTSGAVLLLRPDAVREVGGFDERFFLYGEDQDLGRRLGAAGWETWIHPRSRANHAIAGSQGGVSTRWLGAIHDQYAERAGRIQVIAFDLVIALGLAIRALAPMSGRGTARSLHRRRMASGAWAALGLAAAAASGRSRPLSDPRDRIERLSS